MVMFTRYLIEHEEMDLTGCVARAKSTLPPQFGFGLSILDTKRV